jgi:hypothetical protein
MTPGYDREAELPARINRATDMLFESMGYYDAERCRQRVLDALYYLIEGEERPKNEGSKISPK